MLLRIFYCAYPEWQQQEAISDSDSHGEVGRY